MKNKTKRRSRNRKRPQNKKRSRRARKGSGTGEEFRFKKEAIRELGEREALPVDITDIITKQFAASTIQKYKPRIVKQQLKRDFESYHRRSAEMYDPMDPELVELTRSARELLTRADLRSDFWKDVLGHIYIGLVNEQYTGGPAAQNYNEVEANFLELLQKFTDYDIDIQNYLEDENLQITLTLPIFASWQAHNN